MAGESASEKKLQCHGDDARGRAEAIHLQAQPSVEARRTHMISSAVSPLTLFRIRNDSIVQLTRHLTWRQNAVRPTLNTQL